MTLLNIRSIPCLQSDWFPGSFCTQILHAFLVPSSNVHVQSTFSLHYFAAPTVIGEMNKVPGPSLSDTNIFLVHINTRNLNSSLKISTSQFVATNEHQRLWSRVLHTYFSGVYLTTLCLA
jgi:hypothetical protein